MLENFLADLKASLTVSPIVKDIEILLKKLGSIIVFRLEKYNLMLALISGFHTVNFRGFIAKK